ncbi:hypothetical protein HYDPIDRAFT_39589 [Hydnomerulius pinastri MD-312]|nr:hypothetical protein HYDPIDRAFT_39589 [Hydnomerulius pinastri MD-312]
MGDTLQAKRTPFSNADIVYQILMAISDFASLAAIIATSKEIYSVYCAHHASIHRAIAYNLVGSALPQALRYVRCRRQGLTFRPPNEMLEEDEVMENPVLTCDEINDLTEVSASAKQLEDLFSWRDKGCLVKSTPLSAVESHRFHRALFRLCLYSSAYGGNAYDEGEFLSGPDPNDPKLHKALVWRKEFFDSFATTEIQEIQGLATFLGDVLQDAAQVHELEGHGESFMSLLQSQVLERIGYNSAADFENFILFLGPLPQAVTNAYAGFGYGDPIDLSREDLFQEFISYPVSAVLEQRGVPALTNVEAKKGILDEVSEGVEICTQCQSDPIPGQMLWSPSTWNFLRGIIPPSEIFDKLKGYLAEHQTYHHEFTSAWEGGTYSELIGQVFGYKTQPYGGWEKEDLLCTTCLVKFLHDHLHLWYVGEKRKRGEVIPADCWYGYDCRTQRHKLEHASRLNHYCEPQSPRPTRGSLAQPT